MLEAAVAVQGLQRRRQNVSEVAERLRVSPLHLGLRLYSCLVVHTCTMQKLARGLQTHA